MWRFREAIWESILILIAQAVLAMPSLVVRLPWFENFPDFEASWTRNLWVWNPKLPLALCYCRRNVKRAAQICPWLSLPERSCRHRRLTILFSYICPLRSTVLLHWASMSSLGQSRRLRHMLSSIRPRTEGLAFPVSFCTTLPKL